jgi:hypothetical protein
MNNNTPTPIAVTRRELEDQEKRQSQQSQMDANRVQQTTRTWNSSVSASNDHYMVSALSKVRESNVTHHEDLTRINGTWMHNQNMKK